MRRFGPLVLLETSLQFDVCRIRAEATRVVYLYFIEAQLWQQRLSGIDYDWSSVIALGTFHPKDWSEEARLPWMETCAWPAVSYVR